MLVESYTHTFTFIEKYNSYIYFDDVGIHMKCDNGGFMFYIVYKLKNEIIYEACINYFALLFFSQKINIKIFHIFLSLLHFWGLMRLNIKKLFDCISLLLFVVRFYHLSGDVVALLKTDSISCELIWDALNFLMNK